MNARLTSGQAPAAGLPIGTPRLLVVRLQNSGAVSNFIQTPTSDRIRLTPIPGVTAVTMTNVSLSVKGGRRAIKFTPEAIEKIKKLVAQGESRGDCECD